VRRRRERGEDVADLVPPAPLLFRVSEHVAQRFPEPQCAVASICRAPSRTISSSSDELAMFSLDASASWTTLSISAPSRTSAPTPVLIRVL
jgi:hypothetical protein